MLLWLEVEQTKQLGADNVLGGFGITDFAWQIIKLGNSVTVYAEEIQKVRGNWRVSEKGRHGQVSFGAGPS
jgi:hypothetical protein